MKVYLIYYYRDHLSEAIFGRLILAEAVFVAFYLLFVAFYLLTEYRKFKNLLVYCICCSV